VRKETQWLPVHTSFGPLVKGCAYVGGGGIYVQGQQGSRVWVTQPCRPVEG
jgi:hypothetical protein